VLDVRRIARIAERLQHREIDAVTTVWNGASLATGPSNRGAVPRKSKKRSREAIPRQEVLDVGEAHRLAGVDIDDLRVQRSDLVIQVEQYEWDVVTFKGEARASRLID
jgi:hypothetical protein